MVASFFSLLGRINPRGAVCLLLVAGTAFNCSEMTSDADGYASDDLGQSRGGSSSLDLGALGGADSLINSRLSALCGSGSCVPDDGETCEPDNAGGASSSLGGQGGADGAEEADSNGASCQLEVACEGESCKVQRSCLALGEGELGERGAPCIGSSDCQAGLACVGDSASGTCQPYCCRGTAQSCGKEDFCGARPLAGQPETLVPVCLPTENCSLAEPFPCPEGGNCACGGDRACVVVRADGQTACAVPGAGKEGDECTGNEPGECAHGYVCSRASGCLRLCNTVGPETGCYGGDSCQTPADFPTDLGVCVSETGGSPVAK